LSVAWVACAEGVLGTPRGSSALPALLPPHATCRIADGPVRVELQRTLLTDVPGVMFGVVADAFSNEDGSPVKGVLSP